LLISGNSDPFKKDSVSYGTTSRSATELEEELATETSCTPSCDIFADPAAWPQVVITSGLQLGPQVLRLCAEKLDVRFPASQVTER